MPGVPNIRFSVSKHVNLFYHVCVLFSEYFPDEYSLGILNNASYRQQHQHLKTQSLHQKFQLLQQYSFYTWDFVGISFLEANTVTSSKEILEGVFQSLAGIWLEILSEAVTSYENLWVQTEAKLEEYMSKFEAQWNPISKSVLTRMANIAKLPWKTENVNVHLLDCVFGAQSWSKDVVVPAFPDMDVEKKLLAHEITHILVPDYFLKTKLQGLGLDAAISHTIVDLIAYFAVKEYVTDPERRGIKPNPNYYVQVAELYPILENCYKNPCKYEDFDDILKQIKP